jgi:hypothetical protein
VTARLIPRFLWQTASIDVYLGDRCILRSGGKLKLVGSASSTFEHADTLHSAVLRWQLARQGSFPYTLEIDDAPLVESIVRVGNAWAVALAWWGLALAIVLVWVLR